VNRADRKASIKAARVAVERGVARIGTVG
jgi:hypothetical protein